ncbi:DUF1501 domain-containing protein [Halioxenophilus aromaticivorans]|uniref:DUF1501 domain-containing protein n=1 Tax=Halioxenophilus aromaticivorans TaxID=1306992 RepID=A0AAV3U1E3_9ALTE
MANTDITRRTSLKLAIASCGLLMNPVLLANAATDSRLVVIVLRGAMDGLDVVRPVGDPHLSTLRPNLGNKPGPALTDFYQLHPLASNLMPLWREESLAFVHAVATPYRDKRSHFEGQDFLECGLSSIPTGVDKQSGWLNRFLASIPSHGPRTGFSVAREGEIILTGQAPITRWFPKTNVNLSSQGQRLMAQMYEDDPLLHPTAAQAFELLEETKALRSKAGKGEAPLPGYLQVADYLAQQLLGDTRVASFTINGWDTHKNQQNTLVRPMKELTESLLHMRKTLGKTWDDTTILAITEFGRTARENGTGGTDHGTGGLMIMAGGGVRGGKVYGKWPGLGEGQLYQNRDLLPTVDVRRYVAGVSRGQFGISDSQVARIFPGVDMAVGVEDIVT